MAAAMEDDDGRGGWLATLEKGGKWKIEEGHHHPNV
jgi:hypothetical protein